MVYSVCVSYNRVKSDKINHQLRLEVNEEIERGKGREREMWQKIFIAVIGSLIDIVIL